MSKGDHDYDYVEDYGELMCYVYVGSISMWSITGNWQQTSLEKLNDSVRESAVLAGEGLLSFSKTYLTGLFLDKNTKPLSVDIYKIHASKQSGKLLAMQTNGDCFCLS